MTERVPHADFPSDETLAAFIDGRLEPETRRRVVEHIATCPECYDVVLSAQELRGYAAPGKVVPFRRPGLRVVALAAAAAAVVIAFFTTPIRERIMPHPKSGLAALADAAPPQRNIEGRLSGFPYRPLKPVMRGGEDEDHSAARIKLLAVAAQVASDAEKNPTADNLHAYGVSLLMLGKYDVAVEKLEAALRKETRAERGSSLIQKSMDVPLLNDLSAAYYARWGARGNIEDGLAAVSAADRSYRIRPTADSAFNRALSIEAVHGRDQAADAWADFERVAAADDGWRREAAAHAARLRRSSKLEIRSGNRLQNAIESGKGEGIRDAVRHGHFPAMVLVLEDLLPRWASALRAGNTQEAARLLQVSAEIGEAIKSDTGDRFITDAVTTIRSAQDRKRVLQLVAAHADYALGRTAFRLEHVHEAEAFFVQARGRFHDAGSPVEMLAARYEGASQLYQKEYGPARTTLANAAETFASSRERYPGAYGLIDWALGVVEIDAGFPQEARDRFSDALDCFRLAQQPENIAGAHALLADALSYLGDQSGAWNHRKEAIAALNEINDSDRFFPTASDAEQAAVSSGHYESAKLFSDLMVGYGRRVANPLLTSEALVDRSQALAELQDFPAAARDIRDARSLAAAITEPRRRHVAEVQVARAAAQIAALTDVPRAVHALSAIVAENDADTDHYAAASLLEQIGDLEWRSGHAQQAIDAYVRGVNELQSVAADVKDADARSKYLARFDRLDSALVAALWKSEDRIASWAVFERSRRRSWMRPASMRNVTLTDGRAELRQLQGRIPVETGLLALAVAGDRTIGWFITSDAFSTFESKLTEADCDAITRSLNDDHDPRAFAPAIARLQALLIAPIQGALPPRLVIIADKRLRSVPFAALYDGASHRYLVENHAIALAPSAEQWTTCMTRDAKKSGPGLPDILIAFNDDATGFIRPLTDVATEVRAIVALYGQRAVAADAMSKSDFLTRASGRRVVHFAGHAVRNADYPEYSSLLLRSTPGATSLYAHEIIAHRFQTTRVVVLSSCGTRTNVIDQSTAGLPEAFLNADAAAVVAALRPVDDHATTELMIALHRELARGSGAADALRRAQIEAIQSGADPRQWGSWEVIGAC